MRHARPFLELHVASGRAQFLGNTFLAVPFQSGCLSMIIFRKPDSTFPDHALARALRLECMSANVIAARAEAPP
jgi:hypothetical protein